MLPLPSEQVSLEARRVLPLLAPGRVLCGVEDGYGLFDLRSFRPRTNLRVQKIVVEALARSEFIELKPRTEANSRPTHYVLTEIGRAFLARLGAGDQAFAGQHRLEGRTRTNPVSQTMVPPIERLKTRKGADGAPFLTGSDIAASEQLSDDFNQALASAAPKSAWWMHRIDNTRPADYSPTAAARRAEAARSRFWHAVDAMGKELAPIVVAAVCHQASLETAEIALGLPARSGKTLLKAGLGALARHYGLSPGSAARDNVRAAVAGPLPSEAHQ